MKLKRIEVSNYRNIDGLIVDFHPTENYIIAENNLGKRNFLAPMEIVCNGRSFEEVHSKQFTSRRQYYIRVRSMTVYQTFMLLALIGGI